MIALLGGGAGVLDLSLPEARTTSLHTDNRKSPVSASESRMESVSVLAAYAQSAVVSAIYVQRQTEWITRMTIRGK